LDGSDAPPRVLGLYLDVTHGASIAGLRIAIVECRAGKIVMSPLCPEDSNLSAIIDYISASDWLQFVDNLHGRKREVA
jgi:hypothetical protein